MRRRLNSRLLALLLAVGTLLVAGIRASHALQARRVYDGLVKLAEEAEQAGDAPAAQAFYRNCLSMVPEDDEALARYATSLTRLAATRDDREIAIRTLERVLQRGPDRAGIRRRLIVFAMAQGPERYTLALGQLKILQDTPGVAATPDSELEDYRGRCEESEGRAREAAAWYAKAIAHEPGRVEPYERLASLQRDKLEDAAAADATIKAMVTNNPASFRAHLAAARYWVASSPRESASGIARALELAPDEADVLLAAAASPPAGTRPEDYLERGLKLHPTDGRMYLRSAEAAQASGRPEQAIKTLRLGIEVIPEDRELELALAQALVQAGRTAEAIERIKALRDDGLPESPLALLEARILMNQGLWARATAALERLRPALEALPSDAARPLALEADLMLGRCYEQLGQEELRLMVYRRALAVDSRSLPARLGRAATLVRLGRLDEALDAYRELRPEAPSTAVEIVRLLIVKNQGIPAERRRWDEAEVLLDEVGRNLDHPIAVDLLRAEILSSRGEPGRARDLLDRARERDPGNLPLWLTSAAVAERCEGPDAALAVLDAARKQLGDRVDLLLALVDHWARRGGPEASPALLGLEEVAGRLGGDGHTRLLKGLAAAYQAIGRPDDALRVGNLAARAAPDDIEAQLRLVETALSAGDDEAAARAAEEVRRREGPEGVLWRYAEVSRAIERARRARGNPEGLDKLRADLVELRARRPGWDRLPLLEAEVAELAGDAEAAISAYRQAIDLGRRDEVVVGRWARLLERAGRGNEAAEALRKIAATDPSGGASARIAAELDLREGQVARAIEQARQAVPGDSADPRDLIWLGEFLERAGARAEAEAPLRRAVGLAPELSATWVALVGHLVRAGRTSDSEAVAAQAEEKLKSDEGRLALALLDEILGRRKRAEERLHEALEARPDDSTIRMANAEFLIRAGRPAESEPILRALLGESGAVGGPVAVQARRRLAVALAARADLRAFREALELLEENIRAGVDTVEDRRARALILATHPSHAREALDALRDLNRRRLLEPDGRLAFARLLDAQGDWKSSRAELSGLVESQPSSPTYRAAFAELLLKHGEASAAEEQVSRLAALQPGSPLVARLNARLLRDHGKSEAAAGVLRELVRRGHAPPDRIAGELEALGRFAEAEALWRELSDRPRNPIDVLGLARFYVRRGQPSRALEVCERAWRNCPPEQVANVCLAAVSSPAAADAEDRLARSQLDAALARSPESDPLILRVAYFHEIRGRHREAEALYRRAITLKPRNAAAMNNLAWLLALEGGRESESLDLVRRAYDIIGPAPELLDTRAVALLARGEAEPAIRDLREAVAARPLAAYSFHLARALASAGRRDEARQALREAHEAGLDASRLHPLERETYRKLADELAR